MEASGFAVSRPSKIDILSYFLAQGAEGRHKLYAALLQPMKNRVEYAAAQTGALVPEVVMLAEPTYWDLVGTTATERGISEAEAFLHLVDLDLDLTRTPAHPCLAVV